MSLNSEDIKYIKFNYVDTENNKKEIKASVKTYNEKNIFACAKFDNNLTLKTPQDISLKFVCKGGIYKSNSILNSIEKDEPYIFFNIRTPQALTFSQEREYFRVKMENKVILNFDDKSYECDIYDISASGIKIILPKNIDIKDDVELNILFNRDNVKTKAKLVRKDIEKNIILVSFYYINLKETNLDIISQKCIQKQLEDRKNKLL